MKHALVTALILSTICFAAPVNAVDEVDEGRAMVQAAREEIIRTELSLTGEEAAAFWPVHAAYTAETGEVMDRYTVLITEYVRRYDDGDLSDDYADKLMDDFFAIKRELLDIKVRFLPRFKDVIPPLKVARFYQLENKTDADIDAQLAVAIPLIESE